MNEKLVCCSINYFYETFLYASKKILTFRISNGMTSFYEDSSFSHTHVYVFDVWNSSVSYTTIIVDPTIKNFIYKTENVFTTARTINVRA